MPEMNTPDDSLFAGSYDRIARAAEHDPLFRCLLDRKHAHEEFARLLRSRQENGELSSEEIRRIMVSTFQGADLRYSAASQKSRTVEAATPDYRFTDRIISNEAVINEQS